ncbi:MAG: NAD-dependent epimerase/dehydratase family protein [Hellea sp.]|nr:NAD-dependent epimerase/dehydratase family protein [Hellea sp.]
MQILTRDFKDGWRDIVLIAGLGLIGRAVQDRLFTDDFNIDKNIEPRWHDPDHLKQSFKSLALNITKFAGIGRGNVHLIWTAGKGGFLATKEEFETEQITFGAFCSLAEDLAKAYPVSAHHLSSAGGLFEGQRNISAGSKPLALRAYSQVKLAQEQKLKDLSDTVKIHIYRPSSVYGYRGAKGRMGLAATLIKNGISGKVVKIYGRPDTLRDYVFVDDVAGFIALKVNRPEAGTYMLASGKPTSMTEMIGLVRRAVGKPLNTHFQDSGDNSRSMSISRSLFPEHWHPTSLPVGLRKTELRIRRDIY